MGKKEILKKRNKKRAKTLEHKRKIKSFEEIIFSQAFSIIGGLTAGTLLAIYTDRILLIPGLFILLPGFLEMGNAISGSLSARISSKLHLRELTHSILIKNIIASFVLIILSSISLGAITYLLSRFIFGIDNLRLILIPIVAAVISGIILLPLTSKITITLYHHHEDPDNLIGASSTTLGDIINIGAILLAITILL
ncbi:MAG: magnesium transporter [Nanoarchaeota archaeon]|nr:magnesium transporter [Nanoarchaeota archaeon]